MADPVAIAFANANQHRAGLDALDQKQRQVGQDTLQAANMFRSWSDRAQAMEQQKHQFNVTQDLRERQFALNQEQSLAQLAAAKIQQDREALALREQKQKLDEQPMRDAANATLYSSLSNVTDETQLQDAYRKVTSDPLVAKYVPPQQLHQTFLSAKMSLLDENAKTMAMKNQAENLQVRNQYLAFGGDLKDVTNPEDGQIDYNTLRMATGELQRNAASKVLEANTAADIQKITARGDQSLRQLQAKEDSYAGRITDGTQREKFKQYMMNARSASKRMDDVEAAQWEARADAVFSESQNSVNTGPTSSPGSVQNQALDWANSHPNDPRAAKIKEQLGVKDSQAPVPVIVPQPTPEPVQVNSQAESASSDNTPKQIGDGKYALKNMSQGSSFDRGAARDARRAPEVAKEKAARISDLKDRLSNIEGLLNGKGSAQGLRLVKSDPKEWNRLVTERANILDELAK